MSSQSFFSRFFYGAKKPFQGFTLLSKHSHLKKYVLFTLMLYLILIVSGIWLALVTVPLLLGLVLPAVTGFLVGVLYYFVWTLLFVSAFVSVMLFVLFFGSVVAAPLLSILSEKSLQAIGMDSSSHIKHRNWITRSVKMLGVSAIKSLYFLFFAVVFFICSFIPVLNVLSTLGGFAFFAMDCADYSLENLGWSWSQRKSFFKKHIAEFTGFGCVFLLGALVPFLNLLLLPVAVVGAAQMVMELSQK